MSWGLNLYDLREIANNSIKYSSIMDSAKLNGYEKFSFQWNKFIDYFYANICINTTQSIVNANSVYPSYGPHDSPINITIFGYGFENFLCKKVNCLFNETMTKGFLKKINQINCLTPIGFEREDLVNLKISFDDVIVNTNLTYRFSSDILVYEKLTNKISSLKLSIFMQVTIIFKFIFSSLLFS